MNESISWGKIVVLTLVAVSLGGFMFLAGVRNADTFRGEPKSTDELTSRATLERNKSLNGSEKMPPAPPAPVINGKVSYFNERYHFSLKFPADWAKYKVTTDGNLISFLLPTTDQNWQKKSKESFWSFLLPTSYRNSNTSDNPFPGYAVVFSLRVWTKDEWVESCTEGQSNKVSCMESAIGKDQSGMPITFVYPEDEPADFVNYRAFNQTGSPVEYLRRNFVQLPM